MLSWLVDNKEWVFGGVGVAIVTGLIALFTRRRGNGEQRQTSGANSTNLQSGRDINIGERRSESDDAR